MTLRPVFYLLVATAAGCIALLPIAMAAQDTSAQKMDQGSSMMLKSTDTAFAMKAAQGGVAEVQMGKMAAEKASSPDVKAFGRQMVDDHTKANDDLNSVAEKKRMTLPADMNAHQQDSYSKLRRLSRDEFDRAYVKDMVKDHEEDVKEFQKEAHKGKDEEIKGFASRTLPVLQQHLDKIKSIQSNLQQKGSSTK
jgi:putative membrane protein